MSEHEGPFGIERVLGGPSAMWLWFETPPPSNGERKEEGGE